MNKESRKELKINKILIIMGVVCSILAITIIILPSLNKAKIETLVNSSKQMKNNYTTTTESNTWDISKNGDGSVIATLDENGLLTIAGSGEMKGWSFGIDVPWNLVKKQIKNIKIENGVTNIGEYAFLDCRSLISIEIPESVTSIGYSAFEDCTSLTNIEVDTNNEMYCDENGVLYTKNKKEMIRYPQGKIETTYTILSGVTTVGDDAFSNCKNLTSIEIPESVTSIGRYAFEYCTSLTSIEIPESVTDLRNRAFADCTNLTNIEIANGVKLIRGGAFVGCTSLTRIEIPNSVTSIEDSAFLWCKSLTNIEVDVNNEKYCDENGVLYTKDKKGIISYPAGKTETKYTIANGVTSIGAHTFFGCKSLTSIVIPEDVTSIEEDAFSYCESLTSIEIPESVASIGNCAFNDCKSLTSIEIPKSVTSIEMYAFSGCTSLTSIEIPESVASIGDFAFSYCKSLTSIEIPKSVTSIEMYAFSGCTSLTSIVIPLSVKSIGSEAFEYCTNLTIICQSGSTAETYAKENSIKYQTDDIGPEIESAPATNTNPSKEIEVKINVTDELSGVDEQSIRYLWTTENQDKTTDQITEQLANGETLQLKDVTGRYYLWIYAVDKLGNETIEKKGPFKLDNIAPTANINYSTTTVTNQNVTVTIKGNEELQGITGWTKSSNGKELTKEYTSNTVVEGENITVKDLGGNESTVNVKILNIDKELPTIEINTEITSTTIKVEVTASDTGSGINESTCKYYIKEENGTYGEGIADGNAHTFTNLKTEQKYYIKVEVTDNAGNKANKEVQVTTKKSNKITSTEYKIFEEKLMIKEIQPKATVGEIKNKIQGEMEFKIINAKGETVSNTSKVATGYKIKLEDNKEYALVVTGDSNGDGEANIKDILAINKHRLNKTELVDEYLIAGDVNGDGKADIKDILQINKFRLGKVTEI